MLDIFNLIKALPYMKNNYRTQITLSYHFRTRLAYAIVILSSDGFYNFQNMLFEISWNFYIIFAVLLDLQIITNSHHHHHCHYHHHHYYHCCHHHHHHPTPLHLTITVVVVIIIIIRPVNQLKVNISCSFDSQKLQSIIKNDWITDVQNIDSLASNYKSWPEHSHQYSRDK